MNIDPINQQPPPDIRSADQGMDSVQGQDNITGRGILNGVDQTQTNTTVKESGSASTPPALDQPDGNPDLSSMQKVMDQLDSLSQPNNTVDIFMVLAAFYQASLEMRDISKEASHAALKAQVDAINKEADDMRSSALQAMIGGILKGSFDILAGGTMGVAGFKNENLFKGISGGLTGGGEIAQSVFSYHSQQDQAQTKEDEADAAKYAGQRDDALHLRDNMEGHMSATLSVLQQLMQSRENVVNKIFA